MIKKRFVIALAGGVVLPVLYFIAAAIVAIALHGVFGMNLPATTLLPITWPGVLYNKFFPSDFQMFWELRREVIAATALGDFVSYGLLTYFGLSCRMK